MSKKISEMTERLSLLATDVLTGLDLSAAQNDQNIKITKANLLTEYALDTDVSAVQGNLDTHIGTNAGAAHPDGTTLTDLNNHKIGANQHPISGVTGLQTALDAKANTADLGNSASRDVGTGAGDVAAGDAPANAVAAHDASGTAHGGNIPTTAQKAALDANATLSGVNPVAAQGDIITEGTDLASTGQAADRILVTDGLNGFAYEDKPTGGGSNLHADLTDTATDGHPGTVITISGGVTGNAVTIAADGSLQDGGQPPGGGGGGIPEAPTDGVGYRRKDATWEADPIQDNAPDLNNYLRSSVGWNSAGSAAVENVGTAIGDVVQLENVSTNPGLPAVDGSQLTNLPAAPVTDVTGQDSVSVSPTTGNVVVSLLNDAAAPGANQVYGTNGAGVKGWKADPAGGGGGLSKGFISLQHEPFTVAGDTSMTFTLKGPASLDVDGALISTVGDVSVGPSAVTGNQVYYVYAENNGSGGITLTISLTVPQFTQSVNYWTQGVDTSKRMIAFFPVVSGSIIVRQLPFYSMHSDRTIRLYNQHFDVFDLTDLNTQWNLTNLSALLPVSVSRFLACCAIRNQSSEFARVGFSQRDLGVDSRNYAEVQNANIGYQGGTHAVQSCPIDISVPEVYVRTSSATDNVALQYKGAIFRV